MEYTAEHNTERRKEGRYESMVHIRIQGFDGYALIRNINGSGFCMASKTYVTLNRGDIHQMQIVPEEATGIPTLELEVEVRWTRTTEKKFAAGFQIRRSNSALPAYISWLKTKAGAGEN